MLVFCISIEDISSVVSAVAECNLTVSPKNDYKGDFISIRTGLVDDTNSGLEDGGRRMNELESAMTVIEDKTIRIDSIMQSINDIAEQKASIEQINDLAQQLSQVVEQNAAAAQENAASGTELDQCAQDLRSAVNSFTTK